MALVRPTTPNLRGHVGRAVRDAAHARDGCPRSRSPRDCRGTMHAEGGLRHQEDALQVDRHQAIPRRPRRSSSTVPVAPMPALLTRTSSAAEALLGLRAPAARQSPSRATRRRPAASARPPAGHDPRRGALGLVERHGRPPPPRRPRARRPGPWRAPMPGARRPSPARPCPRSVPLIARPPRSRRTEPRSRRGRPRCSRRGPATKSVTSSHHRPVVAGQRADRPVGADHQALGPKASNTTSR